MPNNPLSITSSPVATWRHGLSVLDLRGDPTDSRWAQAVATVFDLPLPSPLTSPSKGDVRHVWAGPDDTLTIAPPDQAERLEAALRQALAGSDCHFAATDVSSGYTVLTLEGEGAKDVLAQGCPLDIHPRVFPVGAAAGTVFFKASVWLWREDAQCVGLLVRRSFINYVTLMVERASGRG